MEADIKESIKAGLTSRFFPIKPDQDMGMRKPSFLELHSVQYCEQRDKKQSRAEVEKNRRKEMRGIAKHVLPATTGPKASPLLIS